MKNWSQKNTRPAPTPKMTARISASVIFGQREMFFFFATTQPGIRRAAEPIARYWKNTKTLFTSTKCAMVSSVVTIP